MASASPYEKRLKRHVVGRVREYFAVTAPGLEKLCRQELEALPLSAKEMRETTGGVSFNGRLADCFAANLHLRTANRVLMRIDEFKAPGFGRFEQKIAGIPWEIFLPCGSPVTIRVTTRHCRLHHSQALAERVTDGVRRRLADHAPQVPAAGKAQPPQRIFLRGVDDRFVVSLDSSGDNLYRRGIKTRGAAAPLRETLAAAVLKIAGYVPGEPLIDPMCGAGTFSLEAAMAAMNMPAGRFRNFAFETWPAFQPQRWAFIRTEAEKAETVPSKPMIFASDRQGAAVNRLSRIVHQFDFSGAVTVSRSDFFEVSPSGLSGLPGLVVVNPPYGRRLGTRQESREMVVRICRHLQSAYKGWKYALLVPEKRVAEKILKSGMATTIAHGGLKLTLLTGKISEK